jgi:hypothetical protein
MLSSYSETLVLRGVSVLRDEVAVSLRLGSYEGPKQTTKATPISERHPSPGCPTFMPTTSGRTFPAANANGNGAALWAGRLSRAGVLGRRSHAHSAGRIIGHRWSATVGGPQFTAAARLCLAWPKLPAIVSDVFSRRLSDLHDMAFQRFPRDERGRQEPAAGNTGPVTRTPPAASTRGNGAR